jgi:CheY-like chemotaxis protein
MGGEIAVTSEPGKGSSFRFTVSAQRIREAADASCGGNLERVRHDGLRVLVAEDNAVNRKVALRLLERIGCQVEVVEHGQAALEALDRSVYDLVLLDCEMPVMDGLEAARAIRQRPGPEARIPIIAVTANAFVEHRHSCLQAGMNDFLAKPVTLAAMWEKLGEWAPENRELEKKAFV